MGWLARALVGAREEHRATLSEPSGWMFDAFGATQTASGQPISPESALRLADVYACIRVLSDAAGSLPLITYRRRGDDRERADDTLISRTLRSPSPYMTQSVFVSTLVAHLNGWGNAYIGKIRNGGPLVEELTLIHPSRVTLRLDEGEPIFRITQSSSDSRNAGEFTRDDICHVKGLSFDGILGVSPIRQAREAIGTGLALESTAGAGAGDGYLPRAVIKTDRTLTDETARKLRERVRSVFDRGGIPVLEEGLDISPLVVTPHDAQFVEQRRLSSTMVARIFRIPPYMIGADAGTSMTYSNVEQEGLHFVTYSLRPWLVAIEQALRDDPDLFGVDSDLYPEFLVDALLRADTASRYAAYAIGIDKGFLRIPEVRQRENLAPADIPTQAPTTPIPAAPPTEAGGQVVALPARRSLTDGDGYEQLPLVMVVNASPAEPAVDRGERDARDDFHHRVLMKAANAMQDLAAKEQNVNVYVEPAQVKVDPPDVHVDVASPDVNVELSVPASRKPGRVKIERDEQNLPVAYTVEESEEH